MPELPEVETVRRKLRSELLNKKIVGVNVYYDSIIVGSVSDFKNKLLNQEIIDMKRRGKWLIFELNDYMLLSHLRMEGRYYFRKIGEDVLKHEHVSFALSDGRELRYIDTRKFGRMYLKDKDTYENDKPLSELGLEPWDTNLNSCYLNNLAKGKKIPVKTFLLDQSVIVGIGNIYVDEILFASNINPLKEVNLINDSEWNSIIDNTRIILDKAILGGGTTIRSYESSEGVHGGFVSELLVHGKDICPNCNRKLEKIRIGGRGTYYCSKCQK